MYNTYYQLPISFDILKMIDRSTLYLEIVRSQETTNQYQEFKQTSQNMPDFKQSILQQDTLFHLRKNDFPYFLETGIEHHVLWMKPGYHFTPTQIHHYLSQHIDPNYSFTFYENCTRVKSIKEIPHVHVFIKNKFIF